ncbi:MAG: hypothetical protein HY704_02570 [Gemmatimonadetes bacterium]|nr:hypothetical protein [Gemmatimonadota bacterium]
MDALRIRLFGSLEILRGSFRLPAFSTRKSRSLFSFLVLNRERPYPRDVLLGRFWGECPEAVARKHLRTALWRIRKVLSADPAGDGAHGAHGAHGVHGGHGAHLVVEDHTVGIDLGARGWLDTLDFEAKLSRVPQRLPEELSPAEARLLHEAVELYRGDLLEEEYEDWCVHDRERLRILALDALHRLMGYHLQRREWSAAIARGQRLLAADPFLEEVHRGLMRCYFAMGNRAAALRQYQVCARLLREELDVEPMPDTVALYEEIRRGDARPLVPAREADGRAVRGDGPSAETLRRLLAADRDLTRSRHNLRRGIEAARRALPK